MTTISALSCNDVNNDDKFAVSFVKWIGLKDNVRSTVGTLFLFLADVGVERGGGVKWV